MKIRNVIIVAAVFSLLAISLNGISHNGDRSSNPSTQKTLAFVGEETLPATPAMSESNSTKPSDKSAASTTKASSSSTSSEAAAPASASTSTSTPSSVASSTPSIPSQLENSGHAKYMNQTGGGTCALCHITQNNQYTLRQTGWETCGKCHVSSTGNPIPGIEVQHPQLQMIQGVAIGDILPMPSYKYKYLKDSFSCANCHVTNETKHDFMVPGTQQNSKGNSSSVSTIDFQQFKGIFQQSSCDVCHPNTAETVNRVKEIQSVIGKKLDELQPIYEEWSSKVKSMDPQDPRVLTFMNGATYYTYVYSDGSKGVHNFPYARVLLEKAELIWRGLQL